MGNLHGPNAALTQQLALQLEHPNANLIWKRALEVFGDDLETRSWMSAPREIFGGRSPEDLVATGDVDEQRHVLEVLIRIDYGVFS